MARRNLLPVAPHNTIVGWPMNGNPILPGGRLLIFEEMENIGRENESHEEEGGGNN